MRELSLAEVEQVSGGHNIYDIRQDTIGHGYDNIGEYFVVLTTYYYDDGTTTSRIDVVHNGRQLAQVDGGLGGYA